MNYGINMSYSKTYILYRIYYGDELVYIGRTSQDLKDRLRQHFFGHPMVKKIDLFATTKIEYAILNTQADMYLYEIYEINKWKPRINKDDKARDEFSPFIELPQLVFYDYWPEIIDKWKEKQIKHVIDTAPLDFPDEDFFDFN